MVGIDQLAIWFRREDRVGAVINHCRQAFTGGMMGRGNFVQQRIELPHDLAQLVLSFAPNGQIPGILGPGFNFGGGHIQMIPQAQQRGQDEMADHRHGGQGDKAGD